VLVLQRVQRPMQHHVALKTRPVSLLAVLFEEKVNPYNYKFKTIDNVFRVNYYDDKTVLVYTHENYTILFEYFVQDSNSRIKTFSTS